MLEENSSYSTAAKVVKSGGVIAYPTEAVYGIGCDPLNAKALSRVLEIKARDPKKGLIIVAASWKQVEPFIEVSLLPKNFLQESKKFWPGPVTCVLPARENIRGILTGARDTIAVRISAYEPVRKLCDACGSALVSTSCNISGNEALRSYDDVVKIFGTNTFDYIVDAPCGGNTKPSQIRDGLTGKILRA